MACTFSVGHFVWGQEPGYKWGEPSTNEFVDREIDQLLSYGDKGFVLLRKEREATGVYNYWIEIYDTGLKVKASNEIPFNVGVMGNSYDIEEIKVANGTIYAFVSHWDNVAGENSISVKTVSESGEMTDLANLDAVDALKMGNSGLFDFSFSDDGSKLLVLSTLPFEKSTNEKVRLSCFEVLSMKKLWSHDEELEWISDRAANNDIAVDNKGRAYMFKRIWVKPTWHYNVYTTNESGKWEKRPVLMNREVIDYKLTFDNNNEFLLYATFSEDASGFEKRPHGSLYLKFDADQKIKDEREELWATELIENIAGSAAVKNPEKAFLSNYSLKDVLFKNDGDVLILMEQMSKEKDGIPGTQPVQYTYTFKYGNFLAICLNGTNGSMNWWKSFEKKQEVKVNSSTDPFGSFVYFLKEDRLYVLWNNTELSISSIPPASWTEPDGTKYVKHKVFNEKTMHGTFMHVVEPDGTLAYANRKYGLPLLDLHAGAIFEMSMATSIFFEMNGELVIMALMHNGGKRYRFGFVNL